MGTLHCEQIERHLQCQTLIRGPSQPMQLDYSDLYNIMAFFVGTPDGRHKGRDDLAKRIAEQGRKFRLEHWRWEDMQAYVSARRL